MLGKFNRKIEITGESIIEESKDGETVQTTVEGYRATISSENPEELNFTKWFMTPDAKALYKANRATCRADYAAFEDAVYAVQDEMMVSNMP